MSTRLFINAIRFDISATYVSPIHLFSVISIVPLYTLVTGHTHMAVNPDYDSHI